MKLSVRAATMLVVAILMMAMVAPSATAVAPGKWGHPDVRCNSRVTETGSSAWGRRWQIRFVLKNNRNQRRTVHGRWQVESSGYIDTLRRDAELAADERAVFYHRLTYRPTVDLLACRFE